MNNSAWIFRWQHGFGQSRACVEAPTLQEAVEKWTAGLPLDSIGPADVLNRRLDSIERVDLAPDAEGGRA